MIDIQKFIGGIHEYLGAQLSPLVKRIGELENRPAEPGPAGPAGEPGPAGEQGPAGEPGQAGADGKSVSEEQVAAMVERMVAARLAQIRMPQDGAPGRDATQIEILPAIDPEKSYPRGTYAKHAGGLWRSFETTDGMRGWECIVDGVADIRVDTREREFTVSATRSSGAVEVKTVALPVMLYRGVFKEGQEYTGGDTVTWAGSLWHCDSETTDKPGELGSKGWTLAAKRGRDGRDGANGKDFTKAVAL